MKRLLSIFTIALCTLCVSAQDTTQLALNVRGLAFFKDNEFDSPLMTGYTLPGFRLNPTIEYRPSSAVSIEAGAYLLHYWGANTYPNTTYGALPDYTDKGTTRGFHALPFLRVEMATGHWRFVLGDVHQSAASTGLARYSSNNHGMLRPLYAPERMLSADPEAGLQVLFDSHWLALDAWLDWRTMIFNNSPYQENFVVGLSSAITYTRPGAAVEVFSPVQLEIEHRGGEIDTITTNSVQTFITGAVGLGTRWHIGNKWLRHVQLEVDALGSWQQSGHTWPWEKGTALYAHASARIWNVDAEIGYYDAHKFMTIDGLPLWDVATAYSDTPYRTNSMLHLGIGYEKTFHPGYTLLARADAYQAHQKTSLSFEVAMRFTPSWTLIKK